MKILTGKYGADAESALAAAKADLKHLKEVHIAAGPLGLLYVCDSVVDLNKKDYKYVVEHNKETYMFDHIGEFKRHKSVPTIVVDSDLEIVPAQLSVKKIFLTKKSADITPYMRLALDICDALERGDEVPLDSEKLLELIKSGLQETYWCPLELFDELGLVKSSNISAIGLACMGKEEVFSEGKS